jgi:hypothetical protein
MLPFRLAEGFDVDLAARVDEAVEDLVVQMAQENPTLGYARNVGAHLSAGLENNAYADEGNL